ncbi:reverse transcriptase [Purpureocillium lavendulum]|uniref:Reverse transcriptase n=1 Tax=Purpureocillium lavendulum TaxID=1247861 RepID=A0AB34FFC0_9HYPO|nr:reverse transcriptase [Purpureocillium lavendulum]
MEEAQITWTMTGGQANPIDRSGLCLLSLDGGGVRGLSSLYILRGVMKLLNHERKEKGLPLVKPCEIFDLIGGTSTGGLIAIMLGRLEMDVDECITAYSDLMESVFNERLRRMSVGFHGRIEPKFDSNKLKEAIETVVHRAGAATTDLFNDGQDRGCKVFVCTTAKDLYGITRLRSYDLAQKPNLEATICEAALATSAATGFFTPVEIAGRTFVDGALGANNPVDQMEEEAADVWCPVTGELKPLVKCFISIGTGNPGKKAIEDNIFKFLSKSLVQITTETEETGKKFIGRWRQQYDSKRYFRFNVEQGLQAVGLAEFTERGTIMTATEQYLDDQARVSQVRDCVLNLKQKQRQVLAQYLSSIKSGNWLLVVDNADDGEVILGTAGETDGLRRYLPQADRGRILFTTRSQRIATGLAGPGVVQVTAMTVNEARTHFGKALINKDLLGDDRVVLELLNHLTLLPLAITQAAAYLNETTESIGEYLRLLRNTEEDLVELLATAFTDDTRYPYRLAAQYTLALAFEADGQVKKAGVLLERVKAVHEVTLLEDHPDRLASQLALARVYRAKGQASKAVELLEHVVGVQKRAPSKDHSNRLVSHHELALAYRANGQVKKAVELLEHVKAVHEKTLLEDHPDRLASQHALALAYQANGQAKAALKLLEPVLEIHLRTLPEDHSNRLASQHALAIAYEACGQRKKAMELLDHVVAVHGKTLSEDHPDRLASQHALAGMYQVNGQVTQAIELLEPIVAIKERLLLEDHPDRLASQHELAGAYLANGQVKKAVRLLKHVVAVRERTLSEDHPDRLGSQHELARAYQDNRQVPEAVQLLEHVVAVRERTLLEYHPDRLASQHVLARAYQVNGQISKAVGLFEHVVEVRGRTLAEDHTSRLASQYALAGAYWANRQVKQAVELLEHLVAVEARMLSAQHVPGTTGTCEHSSG